jgi:hypothetical protein
MVCVVPKVATTMVRPAGIRNLLLVTSYQQDMPGTSRRDRENAPQMPSVSRRRRGGSRG